MSILPHGRKIQVCDYIISRGHFTAPEIFYKDAPNHKEPFYALNDFIISLFDNKLLIKLINWPDLPMAHPRYTITFQFLWYYFLLKKNLV
jgi:hypothetical protein